MCHTFYLDLIYAKLLMFHWKKDKGSKDKGFITHLTPYYTSIRDEYS